MPTPPINVPPPLAPALLPPDGTDWNRVIPVRGTDGDTVRIRRQQLEWKLLNTCEIGDSLQLTEWKLRVVEDDEEELPGGLAARLVNLDTPELRSSDPVERERAKRAAMQVWAWVLAHADELRCITYDKAGGFDRMLVDLYVLSADGRTVEDSASQYMLRQGWDPYLGR